MTVKITIIGMGKIGTSVGLALSKHTNQLLRTGHDMHPEFARRAQKMGALDKIAYNLPSSVEDADIVFLALPADQIKETLEIIAPDLKEGAVVMDSSPIKSAITAWVKDILPAQRYYVGLTTVLNPRYLYLTETGAEGGREDLFLDSIIGITAPSGTSSAAIKLAADLTNLLGAKPLFMDLTEADSLIAATHLVPQVVAAALVRATAGQPGWFEGRKVAGSAYAQTGAPVASVDTPQALGHAAKLNREHVVRVLDNIAVSLKQLRDLVEEGDEDELIEALSLAAKDFNDWWARRQSGEWEEAPVGDVDVPTASENMRRWFTGRRKDS